MHVIAHILTQIGQSNEVVVKTLANRVLGEFRSDADTLILAEANSL